MPTMENRATDIAIHPDQFRQLAAIGDETVARKLLENKHVRPLIYERYSNEIGLEYEATPPGLAEGFLQKIASTTPENMELLVKAMVILSLRTEITNRISGNEIRRAAAWCGNAVFAELLSGDTYGNLAILENNWDGSIEALDAGARLVLPALLGCLSTSQFQRYCLQYSPSNKPKRLATPDRNELVRLAESAFSVLSQGTR